MFAVPKLPVRRSTRLRKEPKRYLDEQQIPDLAKLSVHCKRAHKEFGCAADAADHFPEYHDSLHGVFIMIL